MSKKSDPPDTEETDPEIAAETVLEFIDSFTLSGSSVPLDKSREFWESIVSSLKTRIEALG